MRDGSAVVWSMFPLPLLLPSAQFCSLFKGKDMCQFQVEALLCAVHCDAGRRRQQADSCGDCR